MIGTKTQLTDCSDYWLPGARLKAVRNERIVYSWRILTALDPCGPICARTHRETGARGLSDVPYTSFDLWRQSISQCFIYKSLFTENSVATQKQYSTSINTNKIQNTTIKSITSSLFTKLNYLLRLITKLAKTINCGNVSYYKLILPFLSSQLGRSIAM